MVTVAPTGNEMSRFQVGQFILHGLKREIAQASELTHIQLGPRIREEKPKDFRAHQRKQPMQERFLHGPIIQYRPL